MISSFALIDSISSTGCIFFLFVLIHYNTSVSVSFSKGNSIQHIFCSFDLLDWRSLFRSNQFLSNTIKTVRDAYSCRRLFFQK